MHLKVAFDLDFSLCCGQVFRWKKIGDWWYGVVGEKIVKIRQRGCELEFENVDKDFVLSYFGLTDNLDDIGECIAKDDYIKKALRQYEGLRIVRQLPWECLISFICATYKSIAAIELMLKKISTKFGEKRSFDGMDFYAFPTVEQLANASENGLRECGLGYRAKYVQVTARKIRDEKINLERFEKRALSGGAKETLGVFWGWLEGGGLCAAVFAGKTWRLSPWMYGLNGSSSTTTPTIFLKIQSRKCAATTH